MHAFGMRPYPSVKSTSLGLVRNRMHLLLDHSFDRWMDFYWNCSFGGGVLLLVLLCGLLVGQCNVQARNCPVLWVTGSASSMWGDAVFAVTLDKNIGYRV